MNTHRLAKDTPEARARREAEAAERQRKAEEDQRLAVRRTIETLREEGNQRDIEADRLTCLLAEFPDVRKHVGRWNKVAYYSKAANTRATGFDQRYNCGCCPDSPLEIWPYVETAHGRLYTDPPMFTVGERAGMGARPNPGWERRIRDALIPETIIEGVTTLFIEYLDEEEKGEDGGDEDAT